MFLVLLTVSDLRMRAAIEKVVKDMALYPVLIVVCWMPSMIQGLFISDNVADSTATVAIRSISIAQGGLVSLIFMFSSLEFQHNWGSLLLSALNIVTCHQFTKSR